MKLLHIVASPRLDGSTTLGISRELLGKLARERSDVDIETLDLFQADLPAIAGDNIEAKYTLLTGMPIGREHEQSWRQIEREIARFRDADAYVVTAPMWNFGIPYALKYYIDCIVQPGYLFRFDENGIPRPLLEGKRMIVVTSSGSDYSAASPLHSLDHFEPYLRTIFGFVGISDVTFVHAHGVDISPEARAGAVATAMTDAATAVATAGWVEESAAAA
ncbi:NAD(P)H-dependent oxidoreductase [Microbacterium aoyamense]|uniref:FMN dependent NADH:quinone oxidoreductase n=1 Tax=Microbacterium aoyamense TaxID=344166 RepID=A0ABP5B792_9MICO|nr:NAD(P)H-dependent oxidoreductase [Microbacterium aoyamense]